MARAPSKILDKTETVIFDLDQKIKEQEKVFAKAKKLADKEETKLGLLVARREFKLLTKPTLNNDI